MIKTIIIDDEESGRLSLRKKIEAYCPELNITAEAEDGEQALEIIAKLEPSLIFLDIEMPRLNGFEMLNKITYRNFHIIFTTAYNHYAIKAIRYAAFDYLLKPVDVEELKNAVAGILKANPRDTHGQLEMLKENMQHPKRKINKLAVATVQGLTFLDINDILHLEANSNYTIIHLADKTKLTTAKVLKEFEELLPQETFFRVHHSHIINLSFIKKYIKGEGGFVELENGHNVDVSRSRKKEFLDVFNQ
jgi:two-component system, LytTR family, response regulator